jgi:soluble lytic murein transglycosylase-like protein
MSWTDEFDKHFCVAGKKYGLKKLVLKSIAITESSLIPTAYRFEPGYWERYLKDKPEWKDKDPRIVSASHGLMQIMWPVAVGLGFNGSVDDLRDPMTNIMLGAKLMRQLIDRAIQQKYSEKFYWLSPLQVAAARWNGGSKGNPDDAGELRNRKYVRRVMTTWGDLRKTEAECSNEI